MSCSDNTCGTGIIIGGNLPLPGDPDNNSILSATPAFGGIDVAWTYPGTNPQAVAYVRLFRGINDDFAQAVERDKVAGTFYYDRVDSVTRYYYWIQFVTINGTHLDVIGPASAIGRPLIQEMIELLTGKIDAGVLAQSLKQQIDKITLNATDLTNEIANRISSNAALAAALAEVQSGVTQAIGFVHNETTARIEGQNALVTQLNLVAAVNANNAAAIISEQQARISADSALATSIQTVQTATGNNAAAIQNEITARTNADSALAGQISTVQSSMSGQISSVQQTLQTNINTVDGKVTGIGALYNVKVNVNGLAGGFGIYNDGTEVEAGFDVDRFWIGRTQANKRKPFIIEGGVVYIDEAAINKLTFSKLRDESGSFIVQNGKVQANYLRVTEAAIENLAVTRLKIAGNSVTVPKYAFGGSLTPATWSRPDAGPSGLTTCVQVNFNLPEACDVLIIGSISFSNSAVDLGQITQWAELYVDSTSLVSQSGYWYHEGVTLMRGAYLGAGNHVAYIGAAGNPGTAVDQSTIFVLAAMR